MWRYLLWLLAIAGLIIILIYLLIPSGSKTPTGRTLVDYASTNAVARLTIDGPEVANQNHQSIQINVGQNNVTYEQLNGYENHVANLQSFTSNEPAFDVFLRSLYYAAFNKGNTNPDLSNEQGICPLGDRYIFELIYNNNDVERFWATSCGGTKTYGGNLNLTLTLFENQVPNYSNLTENVNI